jgi:hypothetical protein
MLGQILEIAFAVALIMTFTVLITHMALSLTP